jgi:hypothetical protein
MGRGQAGCTHLGSSCVTASALTARRVSNWSTREHTHLTATCFILIELVQHSSPCHSCSVRHKGVGSARLDWPTMKTTWTNFESSSLAQVLPSPACPLWLLLVLILRKYLQNSHQQSKQHPHGHPVPASNTTKIPTAAQARKTSQPPSLVHTYLQRSTRYCHFRQ